MSLARRSRRGSQQKRRLHMLADRFYDEVTARDDKQGRNRTARMIGEREMVCAYVEGSEYHRARIEEFAPA